MNNRKKVFWFFVCKTCAAILVLLAAALFPSPAFAQSSSPRLVHLNTTDGLSHDIARCIIQDYLGFIWIGTQGGLDRFDGNSFVSFHHLRSQPDSLSNDTINVLYESAQGELWIGTVSGLDRLAADRKSFVHYGEIYESVNAILEDSQGIMWIGTAGSGLYRYDRTSGSFRQYLNDPADESSLSDNHINALIEDEQGQLWIGTEYGGLNVYDRTQDRFAAFHHASSDPFSLPNERVTALLIDPNGVLWVGTGNLQDEKRGGLVTYNPLQKRFFPQNLVLSNLQVTSLMMDPKGTLWVGSQNGLFAYDPLSKNITPFQHNPLDPSSLSENKITYLFVDDSGILWIATDGGGINKYAPAKDRFHRYQADPLTPNSIQNAAVGAVLKDHAGTLWIGYHNNGLDHYDRSIGKIRHYIHDENDPHSLNHNHVTALFEDHNHNLWIGTARGLDRFDPKNDAFIHYYSDENNPRSIAAGAVKVIYEDRAHQIWIATEEPGTLNSFDPLTGLFTRYVHDSDLPTSMIDTYGIRALIQDKKEDLWLGTYSGLVHFDLQSGIFTQYRHDPADPSSLSNDFVWSLYQGQDGRLWVGTHAGLNAFDPSTKEFTVYTVEDGLPDDSIVSILGDQQDNLWLGTMGKGISVFNPYMKTFKNYDISDGLQGNSFIIGSASQSPDGEMFFGGIDGFNAFYPQDIHENPHIPPVVLTAFRKFDQVIGFEKDINDLEEIRLSYQDTFFAFEFAALDYTDSSKNQYAYRLEGFDKEWIDNGNRHYASYTNIPPGKYVFRVKGSNNDGVWNEQGAAINIIITPPFWQTWWFRFLTFSVLGSLLYLFVNARLSQVTKLRISEERFRSLFENAPLGVCELDLSYDPIQIIQVNRKWSDMFQEEQPGNNQNALLHYFPNTEYPKIQHCLQENPSNHTLSLETKAIRSNGSEFPARISAAALRHNPLHYILTIEDITIEKERKSEEEAIGEERRRIAHEIHDGLAQDLAALRLQTRRWQSMVDSNPEKLKSEFEWLHGLLGEKIREIRSVIFALRPVALEELGFWSALERFLTEFGEQNQLIIYNEVIGDRQSLSPTLEPLLFRILQETMHNVARHAQAHSVWLTFDFSHGVTLMVKDDGIGFDSSKLTKLAQEGHLGLQQMRERIEALGGSIEIESHIGKGTTIIIKLENSSELKQ